MEPVTFAVAAAGLAALGAIAGYKRVQLDRFLRALENHPRVEVRERAQGRVLFSALVACPPRGTVSVVLDRTTGALEWTFDAHLVRLGALSLALERDGVRTDDALRKARLEAHGPLRTARAALFADTWSVQRLAVSDGGLLLEARERARVGDLDVDDVVRRADALSLVAAALGDALDDGEAEAARLCPLCRSEPLKERAGQLGEAACPHCRGRFLLPDAARRLFEDELGEDLFALRDTATTSRGALSCAECHVGMRPVVVKEQIVNLCAGCGSVWLDENELSQLSSGRYQEVGL